MMRGTVTTHLPEKEYGFIKGDDGKDYYFHESEFSNTSDIKSICENVAVEFEQSANAKGYTAKKCSLILGDESQVNKTPDNITESGKQCKKCGYCRQESDFEPEYECPKCGVVYEKYELYLDKKKKEEENVLKKKIEDELSIKKENEGGEQSAKNLRREKRKLETELEKMIDLREKTKINHILHIILSIVTAGFWVLVWCCVTLVNERGRINLDKKITQTRDEILCITERLDSF